jgi:hypothetical protein
MSTPICNPIPNPVCGASVPTAVPCSSIPQSNPLNDPLAGSAAAGIRNQIFHLNLMIGNFIQRCDAVIQELESARNTEFMDMGTSNASLWGSAISNISYHKNHAVASRVDDLQREACRINQMVLSFGLAPAGMPMHSLLLNTDLSGSGIRRAENAEHSSPFFDYFLNGSLSSYGSARTAGELTAARGRVDQIKWQAQSLQSSIGMLAPQYPNLGAFPGMVG